MLSMAKRSITKKTAKNKLWDALKKYVRLRDRNTCQKCKQKVYGVRAHTSHVIGRAQNGRLKYDPLNLKVLCPTCHRWWAACPPESGVWFREYFPDRWQYIQSQRNIHGTIPLSWYEDQWYYVLGLIDEIEK